MTSRERVLMALDHQEPDRVPIQDSVWTATIERWHKEGLSRNVFPAEYFGFELVSFEPDTSPHFPVKIIEENDNYLVATTPFGGMRRNHKDYSTTPEIIDYPCRNKKDWERIKERLVPGPDRVDWEGKWLTHLSFTSSAEDELHRDSVLKTSRLEWPRGLKGCRKAQRDGRFVCYKAMVGYGKIQSYVASERLLMAIATEPDWVKDMYETDARLVIQMHEIMKEGGFQFDGVWLSCDLGYRNGLLFSPHHFEEQLRPTFQNLFDYFNGEKLPVILHSCGCVKELIPFFIEDGLTCLHPLEVKAGMDLIELKKDFGDRLALMGGIDVRAMADPDLSIIEEEIKEKIPYAKKGGGYIYHSDHSVSNDVSLLQYQRVLELVAEWGRY